MCADINATYANVVLTAGQTGPFRTYTSAQFALGDEITITVAAVPGLGGTQLVQVDNNAYPDDPETLDPGYIGLQVPGTATTRVVLADGPSITITASVAAMVDDGPDFTFSITCTSAPPPAPGGATIDPAIDAALQAHTALVAHSIGVPSLQQRLGMGSGPGSASFQPGDGTMQLNFATSLAELRAWGAAGDAASALATADPLDQPFNLWIDGTGALHARTVAGAEHWGSFGMLSAGADYLVSRELMIGLALHGDMMRDLGPASLIEGKGVMIGPYLSAEIAEHLYLDVAAYAGKSWNDVGSGAFAGSFDTQRWIGTANLKGELALSEALSLSPAVSAFYLRETAAGFTLSDGMGGAMTGSAIDTTQLRLSAGGEFAYRIDLEDNAVLTTTLGAHIGLALVNGARQTFGSIATGLTYQTGTNASFGARIEATGDDASFRALSARTTARVAF